MTPRQTAFFRRALAVALGTCAALAIGELVLRWLLFAPGRLAARLGRSAREAHLYAGPHGDDYWKLQHLFLDPETVGSTPNPDPLIGWTGSVLPGVYRLAEDPPDDGRQLVLLYGDSFAQCATSADACFAELLQQSDLGTQYVLGNFGVGGYGLDQIYLLIKHSIDHYLDRRPIVAIGILVEDDLARSVLSFRCWPKPRLSVVDGALVANEPVITDIERYFEAHPVEIRSYLARLLAIHVSALPAFLREPLLDPPPSAKEQNDLNRWLLREIDTELTARGLPHFFFLFYGPFSISAHPSAFWQEKLISAVCRERSIPLLSSRPYLLAAAGGDPARCASFYGVEQELLGHLNPAGNRVVFEGLRQGILGRFGKEDTSRVTQLVASGAFDDALPAPVPRLLLGIEALVRARDPVACVRYVEAGGRTALGARTKLALRVLDRTPTRVTWRLSGDARRLSASLQPFATKDVACTGGRLAVSVRVGGRPAQRFDVAPGEPAQELEVDLSGARELEIALESDGDAPDCLWAVLDGARIE